MDSASASAALGSAAAAALSRTNSRAAAAESDSSASVAATRGRKPAIKPLLLDQRLVAGLGNIYVCEALWRAGIDPRKPGGKVTRAQFARLVPAIRAVLERSIAEGGSTLRDFAQPDGELGHYASRFDVYGREGADCRHDDGGTIRRLVQGGRGTWYCPKCQR